MPQKLSTMIRLIFLLHRYLGIAVGALMVMWCLSGVVMMYVGYPVLEEQKRLEALTPIDWDGCCTIPPAALGDADRAGEFQVEMLAGRPTLTVGGEAHLRLIDLRTGLSMPRISPEQAAAAAQEYGTGDPPGGARLLGRIDYDQWTVAGDFDSDRPLYRFALDDAARTQIYVSSSTGRVVQRTTGRERFWNWLGAVPHWLYFAPLRRHAYLWSQVVIAVSLIGCFLVFTGIYIGLRQVVRRPAGRWSPYAGINLWHHIIGLLFGVLALTWVISGLLSMNPWGWLEGAGARQERVRLLGNELTGGDVKAALRNIADAHPAAIVSLRAAPLDGRPYFIATATTGERWRLDATGLRAPLLDADLAFMAGVLGAGPRSVPQLMTQEDSYYFTHHHDAVRLPVYRLVVPSDPAIRYYLDAVSGALVMKVDHGARAYRWLHEGLHRMDFTPALRGRPQWDVLMLLLMSGVTTLCATGAYLGCRRLVHGSHRPDS